MRRIFGLLMAGLLMAGLIGLAALPAGAARAGATGVTGATRPLDLAHGWGSAKACLLPPSGPVECFATDSGLMARSAQLRAGKATGGSCPVVLYSGTGYTGNVLEVWPQGYWVNLADYGFDNATVSFYAYGCGFHLADYAWGGGAWYPGYTGPWAATWDMGPAWDWRVSSVYIN